MSRSRLVSSLAIGTFAALLWVGGENVSLGWVRYLSLATLVAVGLEIAYDKWFWAMLPGKGPDLRGTWHGRLTTHWIDPATGVSPAPKTCYLAVRQTASSVHIALMTDESRSRSSIAELSQTELGGGLHYLYRNQPKIGVDHRSTAHYGAVTLEIDTAGSQLDGHYWTDRGTRGELTFTTRIEQITATFDEASHLFDEASDIERRAPAQT